MQIDLNCDLGEGCPHDAELMSLITSANIACGFHAGDPTTMLAVLKLAAAHSVWVGAHPSFPDRETFGRREMTRSEQQVYADCVYQIGTLWGLASAAGAIITHVKAHGALYNMACRDDAYARPVVKATAMWGVRVVGLPRSRLEASSPSPLFVAEGFADRRYMPDGSLVPRTSPEAFIDNPEEAVAQAIRLIETQGIQTLCVHGDNPQAVAFVRALRTALEARGIVIRSFA